MSAPVDGFLGLFVLFPLPWLLFLLLFLFVDGFEGVDDHLVKSWKLRLFHYGTWWRDTEIRKCIPLLFDVNVLRNFEIWDRIEKKYTTSTVVSHQNESCLSCFHPPASYEGRREQGRQLSIWWKTNNLIGHYGTVYTGYKGRPPEGGRGGGVKIVKENGH